MLPSARLQDVIHEDNISQPNKKSMNYNMSVMSLKLKKKDQYALVFSQTVHV